MTDALSICALTVIQGIRDALADEESFHVPASVIEWLDRQIEQHEIDIQAIPAKRREIALIWCIEDVQVVRPDLSEDQAWEVLQVVQRRHDATLGVTWDTLEWVAQDLFGDAPKSDE